eukprot:1728643-Lingulodinium_polyedra.AAC.1
MWRSPRSAPEKRKSRVIAECVIDSERPLSLSRRVVTQTVETLNMPTLASAGGGNEAVGKSPASAGEPGDPLVALQ